VIHFAAASLLDLFTTTITAGTTVYGLRAWTPSAWSDKNGNADEADLADFHGFFHAFSVERQDCKTDLTD
jgi:hypothetical protein